MLQQELAAALRLHKAVPGQKEEASAKASRMLCNSDMT